MNQLPVDPGIAAGVGLAVLGSRDLLNKLLGPTADYIGGELRNLVEKCNVNLDNVFRIALGKLGGRLEHGGVVNPRLLKHIIDEAAFCEDEIVAEYLGGVLASSRSETGRDDRGVCFLTDIKSLSVYQLRTHCLLYSAMVRSRGLFNRNPRHYYGEEEWENIVMVFSDDDYMNGMAYREHENHGAIARHAFLGLKSRQLSSQGVIAYEGEQGDDARFVRPFRVFSPTQYGYELFAWGLGCGDLDLQSYFDIGPEKIPSWVPHVEVTHFDTYGTRFGGTERKY
jgi:hypothetical protein